MPKLATIARAGLLIGALAMAGCSESQSTFEGLAAKGEVHIPPKILAEMKAKDMPRNSPVLARIFKEEGKLEIWKQKANGRYDVIASYDICKWSGKLGPKYIEGDRQAPEGFYSVRPGQMKPNSQYHLAFNIGYPNAYDRANGRTGSNLMVHGACSSSGCYSMTDAQIEQIYAFGRDAFAGGQTEFQIQAFPFRMTAANMARYRTDPNYAFWKMLKEGYDYFEITKVPPKVDVCEKRYVFNRIPENGTPFSPTGACPASTQPDSLKMAFQTYQSSYEAAFASAVKASTPAPKPTINGIKEANIVSDWTKQRARGERVPIEPPSLEADGSVKVTGRMGRIDSPAGRRMAALEAAEAEKQKIAEEKKRAAEEKAAAIALAKAQKNAPVPAPSPAPAETAEAVAAAPAEAPERTGLLGGVRKRMASLFGG
ncbi:murein L,D-transpeptidase YafK [Pseudaminobacter salicylatoxidans]|uniref:Murein L,D-transpeptidase YafK n=1 Tax=Pseudaminobacter salicylatoxidans TaxID=93369 RepID=A0A316C532_PSESE|nr:murein L,D-transpeptidase family protein [Pseudaminobacter salicylatoxidans]PWJ84855.1 murein L,D-transpeptidase YafK [Pseudaminobacter salicylatoxidans]